MNLQSQISKKLTKLFIILTILFIVGAIVSYIISPYIQFSVLCIMGAFWSWFGYYWNDKFVEENDGKS